MQQEYLEVFAIDISLDPLSQENLQFELSHDEKMIKVVHLKVVLVFRELREALIGLLHEVRKKLYDDYG